MLSYNIEEHILEFNQPAKTSRNTFDSRPIYLVHLSDGQNTGIGEAAPLQKLSIDDIPNYQNKLQEYCELIITNHSLKDLDLQSFPSIEFGLETALLDLESKGKPLFDTPFTRKETPMTINGLVWMSDTETMLHKALELAENGFRCIKLKVGAQDFDDECKLLEKIRRRYSAFQLEIRLDANGAFLPDEAYEQLQELKRFEIHSIEQPIMPGQSDKLAELCSLKIISIALDEELIGLNVNSDGLKILKLIKPQYIILKPSLIGGLSKADHWIKLANSLSIGWWATSALESNIGLNAISQWVSSYNPVLPQGLGTGSLYANNLPAKHKLRADQMYFTE